MQDKGQGGGSRGLVRAQTNVDIFWFKSKLTSCN